MAGLPGESGPHGRYEPKDAALGVLVVVVLAALAWFGARVDGPIRPPPLLRGQLIAADTDPPPFAPGDQPCDGAVARKAAQRWVVCKLDDGWLALRLDSTLSAPLTRTSRFGGSVRPDRGIVLFRGDDGWRWSTRRKHLREDGALLFYGHERWGADEAGLAGAGDELDEALSGL
jgi:hypothetical protein